MKKLSYYLLLVFFIVPAVAFAGNYTTSISPSGTSISGPITATFNIQDFAEKDYGSPSCTTGVIPAEMELHYWFGQGLDFNTIPPIIVPTAEMIESGIYTATFNLAV